MSRLTELSLEELSNIEVTSVSRRAERLSEAPSSVFVITADDIRRSGVTSLPEALRLAPNLQVARLLPAGWAISSRGFNSNAANKLLVLVDGRSVYTALFGGVFWEVQMLPLQDIERIEVISGPGGTLWGVNAVNGVINVITRSAAQSRGTLVAAGAGNEERSLTLGHGLRLNEQGDEPVHVRLWAQDYRSDALRSADGQSTSDALRMHQAGARADWEHDGDRYMLQGRLYSGHRDAQRPGVEAIPGVPTPLGDSDLSGAHVLGRWEHTLGNGGALWLQAYLDHTERKVRGTFSDTQTLADVQLQHMLPAGPTHSAAWGVQLRHGPDTFDGSRYMSAQPVRVNQSWYSVYAQDEITLREDLRLTLGARLEHNDYSGTEALPSARLAWQAAPSQLVWGALSRTVRAPTRLDRDIRVPGSAPFVLAGGPGFRSEVAQVAELGWRGQPSADATASATVFRANYSRLGTLQPRPDGAVEFSNGMRGSVSGLELWGSWQARPSWRLHTGFTRLWQDLRLADGSADTGAVAATEGANPARQWLVRSQWDLPGRTEFDLIARYVSALSEPAVPGYVAVDTRLGWRWRADVELSLAVRNLFDRAHGEFSDATTRAQFRRSAFVQLVLRY